MAHHGERRGALVDNDGTIGSVLLYDGDVEAADGIPEPVRSLKAPVAASDGLLLVTPEYNNSIP